MTSRTTLSTTGGIVICAVLIGGVASRVAVAQQSLGAVAKQEEERRKTVKPSGKVYTNDTIKPDPNAPSTPPPAQPSAPSSEASASPSAPAADADKDKKDEKYWKGRVSAEREALQRAQTLVDALQSQVNGLWAEFTACQSPPQCTQLANRRQKAMTDLDKTKEEVQSHNKALTSIQDEARKANVPAGWVR